jgi:hypothetical protein
VVFPVGFILPGREGRGLTAGFEMWLAFGKGR